MQYMRYTEYGLTLPLISNNIPTILFTEHRFKLNIMLSSSHSLSYFIISATLVVTNLVRTVQMRKPVLQSLAASKQQKQEPNPALTPESKLLITTLKGLPSIKIFGKFSLNQMEKTCQTNRFMLLPYVRYYFENFLSVKLLLSLLG